VAQGAHVCKGEKRVANVLLMRSGEKRLIDLRLQQAVACKKKQLLCKKKGADPYLV
jgi:hypothetical protein